TAPLKPKHGFNGPPRPGTFLLWYDIGLDPSLTLEIGRRTLIPTSPSETGFLTPAVSLRLASSCFRALFDPPLIVSKKSEGIAMRGKISSVGLALAFVTSLVLTGTCIATDPAYLLYSFGDSPNPGVIFDASGNIYGTNMIGTIDRTSCGDRGEAFELSKKEGVGWVETVLHIFGCGADGATPSAGLVFDANGNLYGTTIWGGAYGFGAVFELSPAAGGSWVESVLHSFSKTGSDGAYPGSSLIFDGAGNLYGVAGGVFTGPESSSSFLPPGGERGKRGRCTALTQMAPTAQCHLQQVWFSTRLGVSLELLCKAERGQAVQAAAEPCLS
ncbi:MAG: choice-of-anchor tandem repeat GloVer-containing protein, partial [Candidatus Sulfotelmatobacter sp.]